MVKKIVLNNGIKVILEKISALDTVSIGFWFATGSASEQKDENGYTHFIEHILFKGTKNSDAKALIKSIEGVGGSFNAFTSRHFTSFYINIISKYFERGLNTLIDITNNSLFDETEISREKRVIIEEIKMSKDSPEEIAGEQFFANAYKGTALSLPIAGSISNIKNAGREQLYSFFKEHFHSNNLIISIAGNFDIDKAEKQLTTLKLKKNKNTFWQEVPFYYRTKTTEKNDLNQVYFALVAPSFKGGDLNNYTIGAINDVFGGSSYSRLFQTIREKKGLCYNIYSYNSAFANGGTFEIHGSTSINHYGETIESIYSEIELFLKEKISKTELQEAKEMYKGSMSFSKLNPEFIMNKNARHEYYHGKHLSFKDIYKIVDSINIKNAYNIIDKLLSEKKFFLTSVGPKGTDIISEKITKKLNLN